MRCLTALLISLLLIVGLQGLGQDGPRRHVVKSLENYYSLSLKYDIPIDELKRANPEIITPAPGDVLVIPEQKVQDEDMPDKEAVTSLRVLHRDVFHVALMIPLSLEVTNDTLWSRQLDPLQINEEAPFRFIQFYHGFMMAADSLKNQGMNVVIHVFDADQQTAKIHGALEDPAMKEMDLIVGPFYRNGFSIAADFARVHGIPIVNPFSTKSDILEGNPTIFKVLPSVEVQPEIVAKLVSERFSDHRVIIYTANAFQGAGFVQRLKQEIESTDRLSLIPVAVVNYAADSTQGFLDYAQYGRPNLVIIYSENEALPAALLGKLNAWRNDFPVAVIGLPEWDKFTNLESPYLMSLQTHILSASYFDAASPGSVKFIRNYRSLYYDEPLNYALSGFDIGYFFLGALAQFGDDFMNELDRISMSGMQGAFRFSKTAENNGFENINWKVLRYEDYRLVDLAGERE